MSWSCRIGLKSGSKSVKLVGCTVGWACVGSGSSDYSVRVWRLSGEYLQTLGSFVPWTLEVTRFPPDVQKVASFTTFKVCPTQIKCSALAEFDECCICNFYLIANQSEPASPTRHVHQLLVRFAKN